MENIKKCRTCKKQQEISCFKRNPMYKDGFETQCKSCQKEIKLRKLEANKDNVPKEKICRICKDMLSIENFGVNRSYADGYDTRCKKCRNKAAAIQRDKHREKNNKKYVDRYHSDPEFKSKRLKMSKKSFIKSKKNNPEKWILYSAKTRAKALGLEFNLEESDITIPKFCPILNIELTIGGNKQTPNSASIDRIDPNKGYIKGNIKIISMQANVMKNNATIEELQEFSKNIMIYMNDEDIVRTIENEESIELEDKEPLG